MNSGPVPNSYPTANAGTQRFDLVPHKAAPAAPTDLPGEKAVTRARETDPSQMPRQEAGRAELERRFSIDAATRLVVSSTVERDTGRILSQFPEQAVLRRKAFFRQMSEQQAESRGGNSDTRI